MSFAFKDLNYYEDQTKHGLSTFPITYHHHQHTTKQNAGRRRTPQKCLTEKTLIRRLFRGLRMKNGDSNSRGLEKNRNVIATLGLKGPGKEAVVRSRYCQ